MAKRTFADRYLPGGGTSIVIPYGTAASRYGAEVAEVMDQLQASRASDAKGKPPATFRWELVYYKADDPVDVNDQSLFTDHLIEHSTIYLVAIGHKWKGWVKLNRVPQQVLAQFQQRAQLVCGSRQRAAEQDHEQPEEREEPEPSVSNRELLMVLDRWVRERGLSSNDPFVKMARVAVDQMLSQHEE